MRFAIIVVIPVSIKYITAAYKKILISEFRLTTACDTFIISINVIAEASAVSFINTIASFAIGGNIAFIA